MKHLFFLILSLVMIGTASAQVTTSSINGKVTDSNGEVLVGATVIAVHNPTGTQYGALTNVDGRYNIQGMRTGGPYTITVSYVGYQAVELTDITLSLGEPRTFDVSLKESTEIDAVVVVSTANDRFNANKTGAAVNFSRGVIENVPTIDRSIAVCRLWQARRRARRAVSRSPVPTTVTTRSRSTVRFRTTYLALPRREPTAVRPRPTPSRWRPSRRFRL